VRLIPVLLSSCDLNSLPSHDLHGSSALEIKVYGHHTFVLHDYIGGMKESIGVLLAEQRATGGQSFLLIDRMRA
jgi:hypothetical protein